MNTPTLETPQQIGERIEAAKKAHNTALAELDARRKQIAENQAPLLPLLQEHEQQTAAIARVEASRGVYLGRVAELQDHVDHTLKKENGDSSRLHDVYALYPNHVFAERSAAECARWLRAAREKLPALEKEITALVKERNLKYMLPEHLSHLA